MNPDDQPTGHDDQSADSTGPPAAEVSADLRAARDHRIALAAVIVTGLVGVAGPVVARQATLDGVRSSMQGERTREDLAELRTLVDRSYTHRQQAVAAVLDHQFAARRWAARLPARPDDPAPYRAYRRFIDAFRTASQDAFSLEVRLGARHPVVRAYRHSTLRLSGAANHVLAETDRLRTAVPLPAEARGRIADAYKRGFDSLPDPGLSFEREARRLLGSRLPD